MHVRHISMYTYMRVFVPLRGENEGESEDENGRAREEDEDENEGESEGLVRCICRPGLKSGY